MPLLAKGPAKDAHERALVQGLAEEWETMRMADLRIVCADGTMSGHRLVLATLSGLLKRALEGLVEAGVEDPVILAPDADIESLKDFLSHIYKGQGHYGEVEIPESLKHLGFTRHLSPASRTPLLAKKEAIEDEIGESMSLFDGFDDDAPEPIFPETRPYKKERGDGDEDEDSDADFEVTDDRDELGDEDDDDDEEFEVPDEADDEDYRPTYPLPKKKKLVLNKPRMKPAMKSVRHEAKTGKRQMVWKYFHVIDADNASCLECKMVIRTETGSITGLTRHLRYVHPNLFERLNQDKANLDDAPKEAVEGLAVVKEESDDPSAVGVQIPSTKQAIDIWGNGPDQKPPVLPNPSSTIGLSGSVPPIVKPVQACNKCGEPITWRSNSITSIKNHLQKCQPEKYAAIFLKGTTKGGSSSNQSAKAPKSSTKKLLPPKRILKTSRPNVNVPASARTCPECKRVFSSRQTMLYHKKVVHSGIRPYRCKDCGKTFARADSFKTHAHTEERSFLCSVCGKTFARRNIRDIHERAHYGDKRYPITAQQQQQQQETPQQHLPTNEMFIIHEQIQ
ncbi:hypothetical protein TCAL_00785 [Tigriopus californicus]|uniref:BTB domain-containing protein n=1 Tax=Tigriopus californicus TaxID=6832 RepID=A0A553NF02_TIGCA|nr:hypothetical protein TCAL_00785 [Tigriopus californicus]